MASKTQYGSPRVSVRIKPTGVAHIERRAATQGVSTSEMVRWMLAYAAQRMPEGWRPQPAGVSEWYLRGEAAKEQR